MSLLESKLESKVLQSPVFRSVHREGSFLWLLRNEFRLWAREQKRSTFITIGILLAIGLAVAGFFAVPRLEGLKGVLIEFRSGNFAVYVVLIVYAVAFVIGFMQVTERCINVLFERSDLDLLLSSPVSNHSVFAVRYVALLFSVLQSMSLFILIPVVLLAVFTWQPWLLGSLIGFIFIAALCSSFALFSTLALVRLLGAKRARMVVQIVSSVFFALIFLVSQIPSFMGSRFSESALILWFRAKLPSIVNFFDKPIFLPDSWLWTPQRTALGDPLAMVVTLGLSIAFAWLSIAILKDSFAQGQRQSLTETVSAKKKQSIAGAASHKPVRFSKNQTWLLMLKEWKLIIRDPELISKVGLQLVFMLPLLFIFFGDNRSFLSSLDSTVTIAAVFLGSSLVQVLLVIILSGEEARDLLRSAPLAYNKIRRLKLLSALLPIWLLLLPLFVLAALQGTNIIMPILITVLAHVSAAIITFWSSKPVSRKDLFKRNSGNKYSNMLLGFLSFGLTLLWVALAVAWFSDRLLLAAVAMVAIIIIFAVAWWYSRRLEFV